MNLHVEPAESHLDAWTAYGAVEPNGESVDDLKRGLSAEAQGDDAAAQSYYTKALSEGQDDLRPLDKLAPALTARTDGRVSGAGSPAPLDADCGRTQNFVVDRAGADQEWKPQRHCSTAGTTDQTATTQFRSLPDFSRCL